MADKKKRIHNPEMGKYFEVRQRTAKKGQADRMKGLWKPAGKKKYGRETFVP